MTVADIFPLPVKSATADRGVKVKLFTPSKIKVLYRIKDKVRSKVVREKESIRMVKSIMHGKPGAAKAVYSALQEPIRKCVLRDIKDEIKKLTSTLNMSLFRRIDHKSLTSFSFTDINTELKIWAPFFHDLISSLVKSSSVGVVAAIILKFQNSHMTAFQHVIGQILDHCGATDECIAVLNRLGVCVSTSAVSKMKKELQEHQRKHIEDLLIKEKNALESKNMEPASQTDRGEKPQDETMKRNKSCDIIGDNVDISRSPSKMTKDKRRQSWHWFLLVGVEKRVLNPDLADIAPTADISLLENSKFIPSLEECHSLEERFIFHIMRVLVKYVNCLKKYECCVPKYLQHPFLKETSQKSDFAILDLLDKSENKTEDMISILENIHDRYIPHDAENSVIKKKVFGGDVLTNERAYWAQLAMLNSQSDFEKLAGVVHRPEGLHRMMNLLLLIYQVFYKKSSAADQGTLANLRNVINRIDVQGAENVIDKYRAHYSFMDDVLDSYIVAACMHLLGQSEMDSEPNRKQPLFADLEMVKAQTLELEAQNDAIKELFVAAEQRYQCRECSKNFKKVGFLKRHLIREHEWTFGVDRQNADSPDHIALYRASFMKCALLLRDIEDSYKMADGDRIAETAKFQLLLSNVGKHTKYQLWLFRFLAYIYGILSPKMSFEYKWNCTSNLHGGIGHNIPNDNLVEVQVQAIKKKVQSQGSNATYESARKAALTVQVQNAIKQNLASQSHAKVSGTKRPAVSKAGDISLMVEKIVKAGIMEKIPGREFNSFCGFKDVYARVKVQEFYTWLTQAKERLLIG
ncbi:uncharacterized protein LOC110463019 isoform X2 [Mizuhopecten yessoensis]|uniref:uncharacterized protein LOC110463019 isoform X2 n=1 Tax=Mizuhopecten yessoensis TaxID=6573 RepID=UPI000B45DD00|nr:uncharacterized protein LOC110463019 isoform X2 [Mizuhopecten yessoensis]